MEFDALVAKAARLVYPRENLSKQCSAGVVACALETIEGHVYTGINLDTHCGLGFCAEHSAIIRMIEDNHTRIAKIVAVTKDGVIPPCGRCRELIYQVNHQNLHTQVLVHEHTIKALAELLPDLWYPDLN